MCIRIFLGSIILSQDIVDSLPPGLLEGRPAGNSFILTSHQLQQLQQQLQIATASQQHQQTEQVATASGGLTLALHHSTGGGAGVLAPQLLLTSQTAPSFAAYPVTAGTQHTTSIQQVLQHHVRQSSILQSTIQQVGSQQTQQSFTETSNGILNGTSKCIPVSPASPFSSRSLTPSPQQRVITPQPVFHQVMSAAGPVLQLYQPTARTATVTATAMAPHAKHKPPQQILPKPIANLVTQTTLKSQTPQPSPAQTLLLNQMIPNAGVIVGQQTSSGVQFILRSPSPQTISASVPKAQVVSSNGTLSTQPNAVFVQANRTSPQMVRFIAGQSLQLQQVQTSSGPAFVAVPSIQPTLQQTSSTQSASVVPSVATVPIQTSVMSQNVIKKTNNISNTFAGHQISNNSNSHYKKKKRKEEETTKLDLANLIKISGIDEEDVAFPPPTISTPPSLSSSVSSLSSSSSVSLSPPAPNNLPIASPPVFSQSQQIRIEAPQLSQFGVQEPSALFQHQQSLQQKSISHQQNPHIVSSASSSLNHTNTAPLFTSLQTSTAQQTGLRFTVQDDGNVVLHQPQQITSQSVTANVAATAQTQLAQLVAEHGGHMLQTAVLSLTGSESIVLKTPSGFTLRQPSMMLQRTPTAQNVVLTSDSANVANGVRILTDVGGLNGLAGKVQIVSGSTVQDHNSVHFVTGVQNPGAMSLTEQQQRVQFVTATGVPDISTMSLTTEQQKHVILTNVPNSAGEVSVTEQQQNRMEIVSSVPSNTTAVNEQKSSIQVIPNTRTVSLTEQLVSDISQQILTTNVPNSSNIHEQNTRLIFQNNTERNNEHLRISSSERTDVHITANTLPETISNQQTKLQMITGLPQNCSISLNQIVPNTEYSITGAKSQVDDLQKLKQVQLETAEIQQRSTQVDGQRYRVISNLEEQQQFMRVNEEQNSIIVEHQRVLNTSTMSFNEQQNRLHVVSSNATSADQQRLLQQLEEQRKIEIITQLPPQQHIMQLNEQKNKMTLKSVENFQDQLQQSVLQQQSQLPQQLLHRQVSALGNNQNQLLSQIQTNQRPSNKVAHIKDLGAQKLNMPCIISDFQDVRCDNVGADDTKLSNQNLSHRIVADSPKSRCSTFEGRSQNVNGVHQTCGKSSSRNNVACSPSSVISPRCTPSPQRSPLHQSPQSPAALPAQTMISTCFTNRPNLTVVTQSSPSINLNQNTEPSSTTHVQNKPCGAAVICNTVPQVGGVDIGKKVSFGQTDNCCGDVFPTPPSSAPQNGPLLNESTTSNNIIQVSSPSTSSQQNSFLETITQTHPNISINKTGIVQPCSKPNVMRGKKPKKSAVVKPMVFQSEDREKNNDGPACLNPVSSDGTHSNVVQRVQTIQLTPLKQQNLKVVQSQIAVLSGKKTRTPSEQATLQKLFNEQQEILLSGKIIPTVPGQNTQGLTFVSTPVRLVLPPSTPPSPHPPVTPPTCNKATSPLHVQVGTQTTLDEPVPIPEVPPEPVPVPVPVPALSPPVPSPPPILQPALAPPTSPVLQEPIVSLLPPPLPPQPPPPVLSPAKRASMIAEQLEIDQRSVTQPDTTSPFTSVSDACKRLLRYHCLDEPVLSEKDLEKADEIFEATAKHLLDKKAQMLHKYSYLLCKDSMREVQTSELIMLGRLFVGDETQLLEQTKSELNTNPLTTCSTATQVEECPQLPLLEDDLQVDGCPPSLCQFEDLLPSSPPVLVDMCGGAIVPAGIRMKRRHENDSMPDIGHDVKKHCPDDEEINAQVQNAIDSILNLQRSDPATDEAVRSILPS